MITIYSINIRLNDTTRINGYPGRPSINMLNQSNRHGAYFLPDDYDIFHKPVKENGVSCTHKIPHARKTNQYFICQQPFDIDAMLPRWDHFRICPLLNKLFPVRIPGIYTHIYIHVTQNSYKILYFYIDCIKADISHRAFYACTSFKWHNLFKKHMFAKMLKS